MTTKLCACGCGQQLPTPKYPSEQRRFIGGHQNRGENNNLWNGGRRKNKEGYVFILKHGHHRTNTNGYVREHIIIFEEYHKCCILPWGHVHHINHIRDDNRIENLEGIITNNHSRLHHLGQKRNPVIFLKMWKTRRNNGRDHPSEETRKKLGEVGKGKKHSEETRKKISESNKGKKFSEESILKMLETRRLNKMQRLQQQGQRQLLI